MKSKRAMICYLMLFSLLILGMTGNASAKTITVGGKNADFQQIEEALNAAMAGDIIEVESGTYHENVNVTKEVMMLGKDTGSGTPVIDGGANDSVILLFADGITIDGFVVKNAGISDAGIYIASSGNTITKNDISYNGNDGVYVGDSSNNMIEDNILAYNGRDGVFIKKGNNNIIEGNTASYNSRHGFHLEDSSSNSLESNLAEKNKKGIYLDHSNSNAVKENKLTNNDYEGAYLAYSSANNITENDARFNYNGISLKSSTNNLIVKNNAFDNKYSGIYLSDSSGNIIYLNNLVDNLKYNAFDNGNSNQWYSPEVMNGNLYSDYDEEADNCTDLESDRICDDPYTIPGGFGIDLYPLTSLWNKGYLFFEIWTHQNGEALSGSPAKIMIDFPTYWLEGPSLVSSFPVEVDPSTKAILGEGTSLSGDLGGGASSLLYPVEEVPYRMNNFTILSIEDDVLNADYCGQQITLGANESWELESQRIETYETARIKVTTKTTIWNHGRVWLKTEDLI